MADLYTPPKSDRFIESPAPGDLFDVVNWPGCPSSSVFSGIPQDTLLVMPFMSGYVLDYDAINYIANGTASITWGLYAYDSYTQSGELLSATGEVSLPGGTATQITPITPGRINPGRTYAVAVNSSTFWSMICLSGNGTGSSRILGGEFTGGGYLNYTHLRTTLLYNATLPATLPSLTKSNAIWPPNPLFRSI